MRLGKKISRKCLSVGDKAILNTLRTMHILKHGRTLKQSKIQAFCEKLRKDNIEIEDGPNPGFKYDLRDEKGWLELALGEGWFRSREKYNTDTIKQLQKSLAYLTFQGLLAPPLFTVGFVLRVSIPSPKIKIYHSDYGSKLEDMMSETEDKLRLASLNIACTEFDTMDWMNGVRPTIPRIEEYRYFFELCQSQVLCFQEAFDVENIEERLIPSFNARGFEVAITTHRKWKFGLTAGLMVASIFPIVRVAFEPFPNSVYIEKFANKGVMVVELAISERESFIVANTHLQGSFHGLSRTDKVKQRALQLNLVKEVIGNFTDTSIYHIRGIFIIGDFNTGRFKMDGIGYSIPNYSYSALIDSLFRGEQEPHFKDLMVPVTTDSFERFYVECGDYDCHSSFSVETGECRGSCLDTSSLSYNLILKIFIEQVYHHFPEFSQKHILQCIRRVLSGKGNPEKRIDCYIIFLLAETLPEIYRKSITTDHICYAEYKGNKWDEEDYDYGIALPIGKAGILSDHGMLQVNLHPLLI